MAFKNREVQLAIGLTMTDAITLSAHKQENRLIIYYTSDEINGHVILPPKIIHSLYITFFLL